MPIDGHFVGNFLDAFSRTKFAADDTARKKKEAKLTGQLVELQIQNLQNQTTAHQNQITAREEVQNKLTPQPFADFHPDVSDIMLDNIQSPGQTSLSDLTNPAEYSSLVDMLANQGPLLAEAGMLGDAVSLQRQQPEAIRLANALGLDTSDSTVQDMLIRSLNGQSSQDNALDFLLNDALFKSRDLGNQETEREEAQRVRGVQVGMRGNLRNVRKAITLLDVLRGTPLEPGSFGDHKVKENVAAALAAAGDIFGVERAEELQTASQSLNKLFSDELIGSIDQLGQSTDQKFAALQSSLPSMGITTEANMAVMAHRLQFFLDEAEIQGISVVERREIEELIQQIGEGTVLSPIKPLIDVPAAASAAVVKIEEIAQMSMEQLEALNARLGELSTVTLLAIKERKRELSGD